MASIKFYKRSTLPTVTDANDGGIYFIKAATEGAIPVIYVCSGGSLIPYANYITALAQLGDDASHRLVTDTEKNTWNSKQSALTDTQMAAVNSGITSSKVSGYDTHLNNGNIHVTADQKTSWTSHVSSTSNPHSVTKSQVGLGNVSNNAQVKGLSTGTTSGHLVAWGADGYTVADSGKAIDDFAAASHTHDDRYYTESEIDTMMGTKEPTTTAVHHTASAAVGSATKPVYVDSNGNATACTYSLNANVPSGAVFTDTKVTAVGNHYAPTADSSAVLTATAASGTSTDISNSGDGNVVSSITVSRDAKGHVTGISVGSKSINVADLKTRVGNLESTIASGIVYKGTATALPTGASKVGDLYRVITNNISIPASQSGTGSAVTAEIGDYICCSTAGSGTASKWDVWQMNVTKAAFFDTNTVTSGQLVVSDGTTGKVKNVSDAQTLSGLATSKTITAMSQDATGKISLTASSIAIAESQVTGLETDLAAKEPVSTAVHHTASTAVGSATKPVYVDSNGNATAISYTIAKSVPSDAVFTDTHNSHKVDFTDGTATDSTGSSVPVVTVIPDTSSSTGTMTTTTTRVNVPTLEVTSGLATRISACEQWTEWS